MPTHITANCLYLNRSTMFWQILVHSSNVSSSSPIIREATSKVLISNPKIKRVINALVATRPGNVAQVRIAKRTLSMIFSMK